MHATVCLLCAGQPRRTGDAAKPGQFIGQFSRDRYVPTVVKGLYSMIDEALYNIDFLNGSILCSYTLSKIEIIMLLFIFIFASNKHQIKMLLVFFKSQLYRGIDRAPSHKPFSRFFLGIVLYLGFDSQELGTLNSIRRRPQRLIGELIV